MSSSYDPFIESLVFDTTNTVSSSSGSASPETYTEDLELWTNAQFTFDVAPGSAIQDKPSDTPTTTITTTPPTAAANSLLSLNIPQFSAITDPSSELFKLLGLEHLVQQQQQQHLVPAITTATAATAAAGTRTAPPLLLPKVDPSQVKQNDNNASSPAEPTPAAKPLTSSTEKRNSNNKRLRAEEELSAQERETIEEDKRRRNTAASARFRAKKKVRERAMEQSVKDMTEKSEKLEERVQSLEREIKWLRTLLIEKHKKNDGQPQKEESLASSSKPSSSLASSPSSS